MAKYTITGLEKYTDKPAPIFKSKKSAEMEVAWLVMMRARGLQVVKVEDNK